MSRYLRTDANGNPKRADYPLEIEDVTGVLTLDKDDNDKTLNLNAAAGVAITLPAVADINSGWNIKVRVALAFATTNWTVVSATNVIQGHALVDGAHVAAVNENTISFVATAESLGDFVNIEFDGTNFYVYGSGVTAGSITFTAP